eukprot:tig00000553_g2087.t1
MSGAGSSSRSGRAGKRRRAESAETAPALSSIAPGSVEAEATTAALPDELLALVFRLGQEHADWEWPPALAQVCSRWRAVAEGVYGQACVEPVPTLAIVADVLRGRPMRIAELAHPNEAVDFLRAAARQKAPDDLNALANFYWIRELGEMPAAVQEQLAYPCEVAAAELERQLRGQPPLTALRLTAFSIRRDKCIFCAGAAFGTGLLARSLVRLSLYLPTFHPHEWKSFSLPWRFYKMLAEEAPLLEEVRLRGADGRIITQGARELSGHPNIRRLGVRLAGLNSRLCAELLARHPRLEWVYGLDVLSDTFTQGTFSIRAAGEVLEAFAERGVTCRAYSVLETHDDCHMMELPVEAFAAVFRPASGPAAGPAALLLDLTVLRETGDAWPAGFLSGLQRCRLVRCSAAGVVLLLASLEDARSLESLELENLLRTGNDDPTPHIDALLAELERLARAGGPGLRISVAWSEPWDWLQLATAGPVARFVRGAAASPAFLRRLQLRITFPRGPELDGALAAFEAARAALPPEPDGAPPAAAASSGVAAQLGA